MAEHPINGMMDSAMENLKQMVDVNTIVGNPIVAENGTVVIPVSKVSFGLAAGGTEFKPKDDEKSSENSNPFGGGIGAGVSISPIAFLVANDVQVKLLPVEDQNASSKIIDYIPTMVNKLSEIFAKKEKNDQD